MAVFMFLIKVRISPNALDIPIFGQDLRTFSEIYNASLVKNFERK